MRTIKVDYSVTDVFLMSLERQGFKKNKKYCVLKVKTGIVLNWGFPTINICHLPTEEVINV